MLLFIVMLVMQKEPSRALSVESALRDQFENVDQAVNENWLEVSNFEELGDWIVVAIDNLHIANSFQSWGEFDLALAQPPLRGQISSFNSVISGLSLIQKRGEVVDCVRTKLILLHFTTLIEFMLTPPPPPGAANEPCSRCIPERLVPDVLHCEAIEGCVWPTTGVRYRGGDRREGNCEWIRQLSRTGDRFLHAEYQSIRESRASLHVLRGL